MFRKKILIVDDIVGSGKTIQLVKEQIQKSLPEKIMTAVCYVNQLNWQKNNTSNVYEFIDFIGRIAYGWVVFPWEIDVRAVFHYELVPSRLAEERIHTVQMELGLRPRDADDPDTRSRHAAGHRRDRLVDHSFPLLKAGV